MHSYVFWHKTQDGAASVSSYVRRYYQRGASAAAAYEASYLSSSKTKNPNLLTTNLNSREPPIDSTFLFPHQKDAIPISWNLEENVQRTH